jgi:HAD superfamily hydrolase (TIGR01509 family)
MAADHAKRGVLFDVDGTLVDSNYLHTLAWWQAFRQYGHTIPMAAIHRTIGMGGDKLVAHLLGEDRDREQDGKLDDSHAAVFSAHWPALQAFDGARELLHRCAEEDVMAVLASSASGTELQVLQAALDADSAVTAATSSSDAEHSKPSPDILAGALEAGGLQAENVVFVGDAIWDVLAAARLGIPTIALTCGGTSEAELRDAGAVEIHDGPRALLENIDRSILLTGKATP